MLPEGHRKALWGGRRRDGLCGACHPGEAEEVPLRAADGWFELLNLAVATLLVKEYGDCGSHPHLFDAEGFCWGCGVFDAEKTYKQAREAIGRAA
jgi:hypothetical protein